MPRAVGYQHFQKTRDKIQAANLVNRLYSIAMGEIDATPQQVNAAKSLLNKVLPDLQSMAVDMQGSMDIGVREVNVSGTSTQDA